MAGKLAHAPKGGASPAGLQSPGSQAQKDFTAHAAQQYGLNPAILWGIYGVESGFGTNRSNSGSGPNGGAKGWMQFEDATAARYHVNVNDFASSMMGAAHYIADLGGRKDIVRALNNYNGNGGGSSKSTDYYKKVIAAAQHFTGGNAGAVFANPTATASGSVAPTLTSGIPGGIPNPLSAVDTLVAIFTDPTKLAGLMADAFAWWVRIVWGAMWKYVFAPPVHKSQRAALFYWEDILSGKKHFGKKGDPYAWALPSTLTFWSLGAYLLWGRSGDSPRNPLNKHKSTPLGRTLKHLWDSGNKRKLHAPKEAKKHTPPKPKPHKSSTLIAEVRTVSVTRRRPVTVTEGGRQLGRGKDKTARSEEPIQQDGTAHIEQEDRHKSTEPSATRGATQGPSGEHPKEASGKRTTDVPT